MNRRDVLRALGALPLLAAATACSRREGETLTTPVEPPRPSTSTPLPVIFAAHGAPVLLDDAVWMGELSRWAAAMPKPKGVLMVSAHWTAQPTTLGATSPVPLVHDFYGFPARYYQTTYAAPGAPDLAARVRGLLRQRNITFTDDPARGLDHGAYIPLVAMYPAADVPVLQVSMPALDPSQLLAMGRALAPLREEGVLVFGSGFLTHNLRYASASGTPTWAREFDDWAGDAISRLDVDALLDFRARAPGVKMALPTWEHYAPLLVAVGSLGDERPPVSFPVTGWWMDRAFTKRSVQFG